MKGYFIALFLLFSIIIHSSASDKFRFRGYSGGMLLHTGYVWSSDFNISDGTDIYNMQIKGAPIGIGGTMKFKFGTEKNQFRIGIEGASSNIVFKPRHSYSHTGWGGLILDYIRNTDKKVHPFIGCLIGGGGIKNHILLKGSVSDFENEDVVCYRKYPFMAVAPYAGLEFTITPKFRLTAKIEYLMNVLEYKKDFTQGIRFYFGFLFCH